jgi:hypothetical protein
VHCERALRHVTTTYPSELATARHPKGHAAHFVKNIRHHLNVEVRHVARSNDSQLYLPIENLCWKPRSRIWCGFTSDQMCVLCELKTPSRVNPASSVVKTMLKKLGSSSIF